MGACSPRLPVFSESHTSSSVYPEIRPIRVHSDTAIFIVTSDIPEFKDVILPKEKSEAFHNTSGNVFATSPLHNNLVNVVKTSHHIDQPSLPKKTDTHTYTQSSSSQISTKPRLSVTTNSENVSSNHITSGKKDFTTYTSDITPPSVESYLYQTDSNITEPMISLSSSPYQDPTNIFLGIIIGGVILISAIIVVFILRWKHKRDHLTNLSTEDIRNTASEKIQAGELEEAFSTLLDNYPNTYYMQKIFTLQAEYFASKRGYRYNELSADEYIQVKNAVTLGLLDLLEDMDHNIKFSNT